MTILKWTFTPARIIQSHEYITLLKRLKTMTPEEIPPGKELDITPPGFEGSQKLDTFISPRKDEGVIGEVIIEYTGRRPMFVADLADEVLEHKMAGRMVKQVNRERIFYYSAVRTEGNLQVSSIIEYRAGKEREPTRHHRHRRRHR